MTTKPSTVAPSAGNFMQTFVSGNLIKFLDDEFAKFEAQAKNCDRYTILDVKLPVRIIELFLKLFQLCVDNPVLRQNIDSVELFAKIFLLMRTHFKAQCPCGLDVDYEAEEEEDDDDEDDGDWGECNESDPLKRFFHYISHQQIKEKMSLEEAAKKKQLKDVRHAKDWLLEQNGILICEICNCKISNISNVVVHSKLASHNKNLDLFKDNELYAAFPDAKIESFGCKACKSEYSTFSSLIKHFDKSQHADVIQKLMEAVTKTDNVQVNGDSAVTTKSPSVQTQTVAKNSSNSSSEGKQVNVMIKYKTKRIDNAPAKSQEKNATSGAPKTIAKNADKISTEPLIKCGSVEELLEMACADIIAKKPGATYIVGDAPKVNAKVANNVSTKPPAKNTTSDAPKANAKVANNVSTKPPAKNTTSDAPKANAKAADNISTKPETKYSTIDELIAIAKSADNSTKSSAKNTTSDASKANAKAADNVSTKSQAKNTANVASQPETKPSNNNSTKQAKNTTNNTSETESKTSTPAEKTPSKAKPTKPECSMKFIVSDSPGKYCQICDHKLPDEAAISAHVKASFHLKMISTFESNQEYVKTSINCDDFICIMCHEHHSDIHELACHFKDKKHVDMVKVSKSSPAPAPTAKPVLKPVSKNILKNAQLNDTDKRYFRQKGNLAQCIVCDVAFNKTSEITEHLTDQKHSQNVLDCIKYEEYFQLPNDEVTTFNCLKCTSVFDALPQILAHSSDHIVPKPKPPEPFKLKKPDEKFISRGKSEKSSRCNLCDKELPTEAALVSHTGSTNHVKNSATFAKNEPYCSAGKTSCSLCEVTFQDLASLVKHFKTDVHQKATVRGKKAPNQTSVHIPSHVKPKLDAMMVTSAPTPSKPTITKKDKKSEDTPVRKSRLQLFALSDANFDELTSCEQFPMKRPDNSYVIAKNDVFYCRLCDVDLPAVTVASHMNGATHRINIEVYESLQRHVLSTPDSVQCTLCKVSFDHIHQLVKHFREKIHAKPAEKPKPPETPITPPVFVFGASKNEPEKSALIPAPIEAQPSEKPASDPIPPPVEIKPLKKLVSDTIASSVEIKPLKKPVSNSIPPSVEIKPVETSVSNPIPPSVEIKPPEKQNVLPKLVKIPKNDRKHIFRLAETIFQCNLCNTKLPDNEALESHVNNLNHKRNSSLYQENESLIKQLDSIGSMFECVSCTFSGDLNKVIKHCKKKQHLVAKGCDEVVPDDEIPEQDPDVDFTITEFDLKCIAMKNGIVRCRICHSKLFGEKSLLEHMNSINHRKNSLIYNSSEAYIEQFDEYGYSYKCIICDVIFTRLDTMIRHFEDSCRVPVDENPPQLSGNARYNVTTYDFECILCSTTFCGFADYSKHCFSAQHEVMKNSIQSEQNEIPYNITITDYVYHCNACNIRLMNKALMEKHQKKRIHEEYATFFREENRNGVPIIEIVGYEYLCNLCWFPMYSAAELAAHERSNMHKSGKNFDDVWRFNERHLIMCESMYKVRCRLCMKTIGIEKLIKHCTSRDHRLKFIASHLEENTQDQHIVWRNSIQYCTLCDCKLINNHNLVNHLNSEKHKSRLLLN